MVDTVIQILFISYTIYFFDTMWIDSVDFKENNETYPANDISVRNLRKQSDMLITIRLYEFQDIILPLFMVNGCRGDHIRFSVLLGRGVVLLGA